MGKYLPKAIVHSDEIDRLLAVEPGWTKKKSGVEKRHYAKSETASDMGAEAVKKALQNADTTLDEIDAIICTSGTMEQPIPCTASLIHKKLAPARPIPAFDINSTCLSFVTGFDLISHAVANGTYKKVVIVASEIASVGLNREQKESYVLFGDAAAACVVETADEETTGILAAKMETYSEGAHLTEIRGGGTKYHPNFHHNEQDFLFDMDGQKVFRMSSKVINPFVDELLQEADLSIKDLKAVVPHQASGMAMRLLQKKLGIPSSQFINVIENYGNTIAASIPLALCDAIESGKIQRGDHVMLLGTSAGLSLGGMIFVY
ncbi:beta-ketoacyl-ACP synthase III [Gracilibacillus oryzae]|uniref:Beta-ketoacyl-ACP synthase III n=1 Tax=Gracilibacillus oryzae TaxID=1672701 RepID=A0A7C8GS22_9BACI|nr:beta-ketoacyl-ACP synthase III [Gracilibacillus oryzae]KAB8129201.1 beta-ketoacyl-ACP synthase III [Gracilibacillus oryzae]